MYVMNAHISSLQNLVAKNEKKKCQGKFRIFQFVSTMRWQKIIAKGLAETCVYHVSNGFSIPWHFAKDYDLVF